MKDSQCAGSVSAEASLHVDELRHIGVAITMDVVRGYDEVGI